MSVDDFVTLKPEADLPEQIAMALRELDATKESAAICRQAELALLAPPNVDVSEILDLLSLTVAEISRDAERLAQQHLACLVGSGTEDWVLRGLGHMSGATCPFCGASTNLNSLVTAFRSYFSDGYRHLKEVVGKTRRSIQGDLTHTKDQLKTRVLQNNGRGEFWSRHLSSPQPTLDLAAAGSILDDVLSRFEALLEEKQLAPLEVSATLGQEMGAIGDLLSSFAKRIESYNDLVEHFNANITNLKERCTGADPGRDQEKLNKLENTRVRFDEEVAGLCLKWKDAVESKIKLESEKRQAKQQLTKHQNGIFKQYEARIGQLLADFGARFGVADMKPTFGGGKAGVEFFLNVSGERVPIKLKTELDPYFGNTLSEGDKRSLALAFFLASLESSATLAGRTVIFDDPMSSFDSSRRNATRSMLLKLCNRGAQVIVLSHDAHFLYAPSAIG